MMPQAAFLLVSCALWVTPPAKAETFRVDDVTFAYRLPQQNPPSIPNSSFLIPLPSSPRVMVLFGGRDWLGERTLEAYAFERLADRHGLILLAPSFCEGDYWEPEGGSGDTLRKAVAQVCALAGLPVGDTPAELYLYGYSAGGQCAGLFYAWMPDEVAAWGAHACGVFGKPSKMKQKAGKRLAPALVSCGTGDAERHAISRQFAYTYREAGGDLLWKPFAGQDHALTRDALALAEAWFDAILSGEDIRFIGEDDTRRVLPASEAERIDIEFRNPLANEAVRDLWSGQKGMSNIQHGISNIQVKCAMGEVSHEGTKGRKGMTLKTLCPLCLCVRPSQVVAPKHTPTWTLDIPCWILDIHSLRVRHHSPVTRN